MTATASQNESLCVEEVFERVVGDLAMIADRELNVTDIQSEVLDHRAAGADSVHISFRLGFQSESGEQHGCLLIPLSEAVTLAGSLMMLADDMIAAGREQETLDQSSKDAILEVGNFIGGASDAAFQALGLGTRIEFEGCQGVRPNVRPHLIYEEGQELITGRATIEVGEFGQCQFVLILPRAACS